MSRSRDSFFRGLDGADVLAVSVSNRQSGMPRFLAVLLTLAELRVNFDHETIDRGRDHLAACSVTNACSTWASTSLLSEALASSA